MIIVLGKRHGLPVLNILNDDGTLNENVACDLEGMDRLLAREAVVERLKESNLFIETQPHKLDIPVCSRTGDVIEPVVRPQWFVKCDGLARDVKELLLDGTITVCPPQQKNVWINWMDNIEDWCISRQLWWGHQAPVYRIECGTLNGKELWVAGRDESEAYKKADALLKRKGMECAFTLKRDEDVLDTWFSAGLLPISALGWPEKSLSVDTLPINSPYPLSMMETGTDILLFWVARMAMLCRHFTGTTPFKNVVFHPLVRDSLGRKMSKSLGNVIDPCHVIEGVDQSVLLEGIENSVLSKLEKRKSVADIKKEFPNGIPECGADALRFALCNSRPSENATFIRMNVADVVSARKFCAKLWNISKFCSPYVDPKSIISLKRVFESKQLRLMDKWIIEKLFHTISHCNQSFSTRNLHIGTEALYRFVWGNIADVYIEMRKPVLGENEHREHREIVSSILALCLDCSMRMFHPFMPFITEEIWQQIPHYEFESNAWTVSNGSKSIVHSDYPELYMLPSFSWTKTEDEGEALISIVSSVRSFREVFGLPPSKELVASVVCDDSRREALFNQEKDILKQRLKLSELYISNYTSSDDMYKLVIDSETSVLIPSTVLGSDADKAKCLKAVTSRHDKVRKKLENARAQYNQVAELPKVPQEMKTKFR